MNPEVTVRGPLRELDRRQIRGLSDWPVMVLMATVIKAGGMLPVTDLDLIKIPRNLWLCLHEDLSNSGWVIEVEEIS